MKLEKNSENTTTPSSDPEGGSYTAFILLGKTGSGKSSFINLLGGKNTANGEPPVISGEIDSCTSEVVSYETTIDGEKIILLDTPGFDDSSRQDLEILIEIINGICFFATRGVRVHGVIFLHDIGETRFSGSQQKIFGILQNLCGEKCMGNVIVGTTMWSTESPGKFKAQKKRSQEIHKKHWCGIYRKIQLFDGDKAAAIQIITELLDKPPVTLLVQEEMLQPPHTPEGTTVVKPFIKASEKEKESFREELAEMKRLYDEAIATGKNKEQARKNFEEKKREYDLFNDIFDRLKTPPDASFPVRLGLAFLRPIALAPLAFVSVPLGFFDAFNDFFRKKETN